MTLADKVLVVMSVTVLTVALFVTTEETVSVDVFVIVVVRVLFVGNETEPIPIPSARTTRTTAAHATLFMNSLQATLCDKLLSEP